MEFGVEASWLVLSIWAWLDFRNSPEFRAPGETFSCKKHLAISMLKTFACEILTSLCLVMSKWAKDGYFLTKWRVNEKLVGDWAPAG